jgi:hypothetical protein
MIVGLTVVIVHWGNEYLTCSAILEAGLEVAASDLLEDDGESWADESTRGEISLKPGEGTDEKLRLIVVGINSFRTSPTQSYIVPDENKVDHIVFQFEYIPGKHRMNPKTTEASPKDTNAGGYEASEMREYLVPVIKDGVEVGGNFLIGLKKAGVPVDDVLWRPLRYVTNTATTAGVLRDLVWLPTVRELFKDGKESGGSSVGSSIGEVVTNQTWLGYYTGDAKREKKNLSGDSSGQVYWLASRTGEDGKFYRVNSAGVSAVAYPASGAYGFVPAFCVY